MKARGSSTSGASPPTPPPRTTAPEDGGAARRFCGRGAGPLALAALFLVGLPVTANAQVNAEALRSKLRTNPRFLWLDAGLAGRTGNTETLTFSGAAFGGLTYERHLGFAKVSADYAQASGKTNVARWMMHARYNYRATELVSLEALAQVQHDRFRRLGIRDVYGAGLRFAVYTNEDLEVFTGTTYIFEHERIEAVNGSPASNDIWNRSSDYIGLTFRAAPVVQVSSTTYFQPRFDKPSDFRILSDTLVSFTITKLLSAGVSATLWYDNDPPSGVKTYDLEIKNTLALKLQ